MPCDEAAIAVRTAFALSSLPSTPLPSTTRFMNTRKRHTVTRRVRFRYALRPLCPLSPLRALLSLSALATARIQASCRVQIAPKDSIYYLCRFIAKETRVHSESASEETFESEREGHPVSLLFHPPAITSQPKAAPFPPPIHTLDPTKRDSCTHSCSHTQARAKH